MPDLNTPSRRHLRAAATLLVLGASPAAAQTPNSMQPTRAELAQRLLSPAERTALDETPSRTREAPSFGRLWAAGVGGGVAGGLILGGVGRIIDGPPSGEAIRVLTPVGAYVGSSMIGAPLGVHLANGRRGWLVAGVLTSLAGDMATAVAVAAAPRRGTPEYVIATVTSLAKVAAIVGVERITERW